jgi:hypothetical protein
MELREGFYQNQARFGYAGPDSSTKYLPHYVKRYKWTEVVLVERSSTLALICFLAEKLCSNGDILAEE